jgi:hypothetical protein
VKRSSRSTSDALDGVWAACGRSDDWFARLTAGVGAYDGYSNDYYFYRNPDFRTPLSSAQHFGLDDR